MFMLCQTNWKT
uniref:Uncharacterized protein n=1 Tax=Arundo donax TaxID=35708 RepID=A0A0A9AFC5_ARUDO